MDYNHIAKIIGGLPDLLCLPFLYIIRYNFYKKILGFKKNIGIYFFATLLLTIFSFLDLNLSSKSLSIILNDALLFLTIHFLYKANILIKLYAIIIENTIFLLVNLAVLPLDFWISPIINNIDISFQSHMIINFIHISINNILCYIVLYFILKKISCYLEFKDNYIKLSQGFYLLIPSLASYGLAFIIYFIQEIKINNEVYYLSNISSKFYCVFLPLVCFLLLISIPMVAYSFKNLIESDEQKHKNLLMERQFSLQLSHMKNIDGIYLGIRKVIHDMNNHIFCLKCLADNNNIEEIKNYLHNLNETISKLDFKIKTGNPICDAIINEKFNISQSEDIEFICNFIIPEKSSVESIDLCILLGNTLDNSIESCRRITEPSIKKKISLKSYMRGFYLVIEVVNSSLEKIKYRNNKIITSKPDTINHGIGLSNIEDVVKKYNGVLDIIEEKQLVTLSIMLKIK
jgi:hypothetical protein